MSAGAHRGEKRVLDPLELDLQATVSYPTWVLGTKLGSSAKATSTLNC